jgi:hypothetical protein
LAVTGTRPVFEGSLTLVDPARWELRYTLTARYGNSESVLPTGPLVIGSTEFVKADEKNPKLVDISWTVGPTHRVELSFLRLGSFRQFWISPAVVGQWSSVSVTGTGEVDGKPKGDSESFRGFYPAFGGEAVYSYQYSRLKAFAVAGRDYLLGRAEWSWWLANNLDCSVSCEAQDITLPRNSRLRTKAWVLGVTRRW